MIELLTRIGERLQSSAYVNEAAVSHGVVIPILAELGWDTADPRQVVPEFSNARGRVDFALIGRGQRPAIFVEVKQVGLAKTGDRQLFEYAYHEGVPLCVLTDGLEWSFYLPSGQGSYDDRRVYRLQLDDRPPEESRSILSRYLLRSSVLDLSPFENARVDYDAISGKREALAVLPRAWAELVGDGHELLLETLIDKVEAIPLTASAALFAETAKLGRAVIRLHTFGERFATEDPPALPRLAKDSPVIPKDGAIPSTPDGFPDTIEYDPAKERLLVGAGTIDNVPPAVWAYEVSGKQVLRQWFSYRKKNRERPQIGDRRPPSPLGEIQPDHWLPEYTSELINVLNVLALLVELEPKQAHLLKQICDGPLIPGTKLQV